MKPNREQLIEVIATTSTKTAAILKLGCSKSHFYKLIEEYDLSEEELKGLPKESKVTIGELELRTALEKHDFNQTNAGIELDRSKSAIGTAMVYYCITKVPRSEQNTPPANFKPLDIPENIIVDAIKSHSSVRNAATFLNISKEKMYAYIDLYDIPTKQSKNKEKDWGEIRKDLFERRISVIEVCKKYGITKRDLDRKHIDVSLLTIEYSTEELKRIFNVVDFNNQGIIKALKLLDTNVFKSIMRLTNDHIVTTDKFTERCYRIIHDYPPEYVDRCVWCGQHLLFYTIELGYGCSDKQACDRCRQNSCGVSKMSQELFWKIYKNVDYDCKFSELNGEYSLLVDTNDKKYFDNSEYLNQKYYALDFVCGNKVIEYGAYYWHQNEDKEIMKKQFLEYKGYTLLDIDCQDHIDNPEQVLHRCLDFLKD